MQPEVSRARFLCHSLAMGDVNFQHRLARQRLQLQRSRSSDRAHAADEVIVADTALVTSGLSSATPSPTSNCGYRDRLDDR